MAQSTTQVSSSGITVIAGDSGDHWLGTDDSADMLVGGRGRDLLEGGGGDDTLDGGPSDDTLSGGAGRDTYVLGRDSGQDTNYVYGAPGPTADEPDRIALRPGISLNDVAVTRLSDTHAIVRIFDSRARIDMEWSAAVSPDEVFLATADGQTMTYGEVASMPVNYWNGADRAPPINAQAPDTIVTGTPGNDYLSSDYRGTTFDLGPGNDYIGGRSDSIYLFNRDSGQDTAYFNGPPRSETDAFTVKLGEGIQPDDLVFSYDIHGMPLIHIADTRAELSLNDSRLFSDQPGAPLLRLVFADGTVWGNAEVAPRLLQDPYAGLLLYGAAGGQVLQGSDNDDGLYGGSGNDTVIGGLGLDTLWGWDGDDLLQGGDQSDEFNGGAGNDLLEGGAGHDVLEGTEGNDTLDGGSGSDVLDGGEGADVYLLGRGSQADVIRYGDAQDVIRLGVDIAPGDVRIDAATNGGPPALLLSINGTDASILFDAGIGDDYPRQWGIDRIEFADGTVWHHADIIAMQMKVSDGNDVVRGSDLADLLDGRAGDDYLYGGTGDDTLEGSAGNDTLGGYIGNDTYIFRRGDGDDVIYDNAWRYPEGSPAPDPEHDVLVLPDYTPEDIQLVRTDARSGTSVILQFKGGDGVTLASQLPVRQLGFDVEIVTNGVNEVRFADGTTWNREQLKSHISYLPTDDADLIRGEWNKSNNLQGLGGDDSMTGGLLADTLDGGTGIDTLGGAGGNDTYIVDGYIDPVSHQQLVDSVWEFGGADGGIDQVITSLSTYQLPHDVENLVMNGKSQAAQTKPAVMAGKEGGRHGTGNSLNNSITGDLSGDLLEGLDGDDVLRGLFGDDTLDGGEGLDTLMGGAGNDTYILNDRTFTPTGRPYDVIIELGDGDDTIQTSITDMRLPDLVENLVTSAERGYGNALDNHLSGGAFLSNVLMGWGGQDTLDGGGGGDTLVGGEGDDVLISASTTSDDSFGWGRGQGADRLQDDGGVDILFLSSGTALDDLWLHRVGDDLQISLIGTDDSFTVVQWYGPEGATHRLEHITQGGDERALNGADIQRLVDSMAGFTPPPPGQAYLQQPVPQLIETAMATNLA